MYNNDDEETLFQPTAREVSLTTRHAERFESHPSFRLARADEVVFQLFRATGDETDDANEPSRGAEDARILQRVIQRRAFKTSRGRV